MIAPSWLRGGTIFARSTIRRFPFFIQHRDQRFAHAQLGKHRLDLELRILTKRLRGGLDRFLIARREGAQRVLHPVPELAQHNIRNIERILADEINADAFRSDQPDHLFDFLANACLDVGEEQMRFVEEENQLRFFRIADFRQRLEQLRKHPEQKRRVNFRRLLHQLFRRQDIDHSATAAVGLDQIIEVERRLAEKFVGALRFKREQVALDRSRACRRDVPVLRFELVGIVGHVLQHRAQIFQIEQKQPGFVGDLEDHVQNALPACRSG